MFAPSENAALSIIGGGKEVTTDDAAMVEKGVGVGAGTRSSSPPEHAIAMTPSTGAINRINVRVDPITPASYPLPGAREPGVPVVRGPRRI